MELGLLGMGQYLRRLQLVVLGKLASIFLTRVAEKCLKEL